MYTYKKNNRFFAQVADGLEELASRELEALGAGDIKPSYRGIYFSADHAALYRINYSACMISRVLAPLITFKCHSEKYLYKTARSIKWSEIFSLDNTFAVFSNVSNSHIRHSQYASLRVKDAISDQFRETFGQRPNVDANEPDVWINLYIANNNATISLDTSGGSLHKRCYRKESVVAPMQETLAATVVRLSGWNGERPLYDPMCGSGTLLSEACMHVCKIPSGYLRKNFGFTMLPDFNKSLWTKVKKECDAGIHPLAKGLIGGSDISGLVVKKAVKNCTILPGGSQIAIKTMRFENIDSLKNHVILTNPPYGLRMNSQRESIDILKSFGTFLKRSCGGSTAYIFLGNQELAKNIPLRASWKKSLKSGGLEGVLVKYKIY